jgi:hypothetical protein
MKAFVLSIAIVIFSCHIGSAELRVREANGSLPTEDMEVLGSGSGVIIGSRHVLTNRHVAQDDTGQPYGGFKVYLGPEFATGIPARVVSICEEYDLALLRTNEPMKTNSKTTILNAIPSLGLRVTAYGFPLGTQFGIGLTATGGQVSRHPVAISASDSVEQSGIKKSVWHDAVLSSGNSGGPLFSDSQVLVGINFAKLAVEDKHALAVPGNIVTEFLRVNEVLDEVSIQDNEGKPSSLADPRAVTVFVEVWGDVESTAAISAINDGSIQSAVSKLKSQIKQQLPLIDDDTLSKVQEGELQLLLPEQEAGSISAGTIARIKGKMTIIQVLDDGMLVEIDGVRCAIVLDEGKAGELGAKFGNEVISGVPLDLAFLVGEAKSYTTMIGTTNHAILLMPIGGLVDQPQFKQLIDSELSRRTLAHQEAQAKEDAERRIEEAEKRAKLEKRYLAKLRHTFQDARGKFKIDAAALALHEDKVQLMRLSDRRRMLVPLEKLHDDDRQWLEDNRTWIKVYGAQLAKMNAAVRPK